MNTYSQGLQFSCVDGEEVTIAAVGDLLLHSPLQKKAAIEQDFGSLWSEVGSYLYDADITYANLEGPTAINTPLNGKRLENPSESWNMDAYGSEFRNAIKRADGTRAYPTGMYYSSFPLFNYHPQLVSDLVQSGFDVVSTANNHSLDRRQEGVDKTIEALEAHNLLYTGTKSQAAVELRGSEQDWSTVTYAKGHAIAWISCTYGTNGLPDKKGQVLHCFTSAGEKIISSLIQKHKDQGHFVIVTPHWGNEYSTGRSERANLNPNDTQKRYARKWLEEGADAIIGAHPHAFQKMEKVVTSDGKEKFIAYSLGNFVSNQGAYGQRATGVLHLGVTFDGNGDSYINGVKLVPAYMDNRSGVEQMTLRLIERGSNARELSYLLGAIDEENLVYRDEHVDTASNCL